MANGDDLTGLDLAEQLRRRQMLQGMPTVSGISPLADINQDQQPQQQVLPPVQQQPQVQPAQQPYVPQIQDVETLRKQLPYQNIQFPNVSSLEQAGTRYANVAGQAPVASQFPRNKLLTALVAPLMLKQFIRDPKQASENLSFLTRKGYGAAEEQFASEFAKSQQQYNIQRDLFKDKLDIASKELTGNKDYAEEQIELMNSGIKMPIEIMRSLAELNKTNLELQKFKAGDVAVADPYTLSVRDSQGKIRDVTAWPHKMPDGTMQWTDASTGKQLEGTITDSKRLVTERLTPVERLIQKGIDEYTANPDNANKPLDFKGLGDIVERSQKIFYQAQADNRLAQIAQQTATREQEQATKQENMYAKSLMQDDIKRLDGEIKPINQQLTALTTTRNAAEAGDKNGAASIMTVIDTVMGGGSRQVARYNSKEFDRILGGAGKWDQFKAKIQSYLPGGSNQKSGIPPEVIKQLKELNGITEKELRRQQKVNDKYRKLVESAKDREHLIGLMGDYDSELGDAQGWREDVAAPKSSLEDELRKRKLIK